MQKRNPVMEYMRRLDEEIKSGNLKHLYLLYGKEAYLIKQYRDRLKAVLLGDGDSMNYHYFEGKDVNVEEIIDLAETLPFLSDRRVIIIENSGLFKRGGEQLAQYLQEPSDTTYFILVEREMDKRCKLFKAVSKMGREVEFNAPDEFVIRRWILGTLKKENKKMSDGDLELFLEKTGFEMENISKELEKLICYCIDKEIISGEDIEAVCIRQINNQIYAMVDAIAEKRQKDAMELYYDLLTLKEEPMNILFLLERQFNLMLQAKELNSKGYSFDDIGESIGLSGYIAKLYVNHAAKFSKEYLMLAMKDCVEAEEAVKTGKMNGVLSVELLLIKHST